MSLFDALRKSNSDEIRSLIGQCLGRIGAIDPGHIGSAFDSKQDRRSSPESSSLEIFCKKILETSARIYADCIDLNKSEIMAYAIQRFLQVLDNRLDLIFDRLNSETKREIGPLRNTKFSMPTQRHKPMVDRPIVSNANSYFEWAYNFYMNLMNNMNQVRILKFRNLFRMRR